MVQNVVHSEWSKNSIYNTLAPWTASLGTRVPVCFWAQFKMLVITYKALHGIEPGYLRIGLALSHQPVVTQSGREGMMQNPSVKQFWLAGSRKRPFSALLCGTSLPHREGKPQSLSLLQRGQNLVLQHWGGQKRPLNCGAG